MDMMEWTGLDGMLWNGWNGQIEWLERISMRLEILSINDSSLLAILG